MIDLQGIDKFYDGRAVLQQVNWTMNSGEFWGIIGPNGSGKTTLLHVISGLEKPDQGTVTLAGQSLEHFSRKQLAQMMAVLQQDGLPQVDFTVRQVVEMGRFPFLNWMGRDKLGQAEEVIQPIMEKLELTELAEQPLNKLSGGQRQRVAIGKMMAQQPSLVLLDEPTTFLDIQYQLQFMEYMKAWQKEDGLSVVAVIHDLNMAAMFCDHLLLMQEGQIVAAGTPEDVLTPEQIKDVFDVDVVKIKHPDTGQAQFLVRPGKFNASS